MTSKTLQAIKYNEEAHELEILDQLKLPNETIYCHVGSTEEAFTAIKDMVVRGAPAIAIVAILGVAVDLYKHRKEFKTADEVAKWTEDKLDYVNKSRPTAVNLSQAVGQMKELMNKHVLGSSAQQLTDCFINAAKKMLEDDVNDNKNIGRNGAEWISQELGLKNGDKISVLTICNTGSLATAGYGTALGVVRALHEQGKLEHVYCLETRPYNQGSRLTAYELVYEGIPATLVTDSMASALLRAHPEIKLVVVGADRVVKNGDTANKIGTYQLAITTKFHGRKFAVAAPYTTIDTNTISGDKIVIEERAPHELTQVKGNIVVDGKVDPSKTAVISTAAAGIDVWNPAFDVTPAALIDAIFTEKSAISKPENATEYQLSK